MALYWQEVRKISTRKQIRECVSGLADADCPKTFCQVLFAEMDIFAEHFGKL